MKNQRYDLRYKSSTITEIAELGTIEKDASGFEGSFETEMFRGKAIIDKLLTLEFDSVLDVGAGACKQSEFLRENGKEVYTCDYGLGSNSIGERFYDYIGDFNNLNFDRKYDCVLCSHILEHQLNVNTFLKKVVSVTKENGYIVIVVPPRKPFLIGGHVSLWNAGMVLYNLILAGVDCSHECYIKQYDYNIGIIVKNVNNNIEKVGITYDGGDITNLLSGFFPPSLEAFDGMNGDILELNWENK
jgi:ubiquinone/menaquinone biosynthesis C-methylase UbiE